MAFIKGTAGNDTKIGTSGIDTIQGFSGDDTLWGRNGNDNLLGADGKDKLYGENNNDVLYGGKGDDSLWGGTGNDSLYGETGNDANYGGAGNDTIWGGTGNDSLYGDAGTDTIHGGMGNDIVKGGTGKSFLYGNEGNDSLYYDPLASGQSFSYSDDSLSGSVLDGGSGHDKAHIYAKPLAGGASPLLDIWVQDNGVTQITYEQKGGMADQFSKIGTAVNVEELVLSGASGARVQTGLYGEGPMKVTGTQAGDEFFGGFGNETFLGGGGNDTFRGGGGDDKLNGGSGYDDFVFDLAAGGTTTITGFQVGIDDLLFDKGLLTNASKQIVYGTNKTTFNLHEDMTVTVDAVVKATDWDWIG